MARYIPVNEEPVHVGRGSAHELQLRYDSGASRNHATFGRTSQGMYVEDAGSANGTWVNGSRVSGRSLLAEGDRVKMGGTEIVVHDGQLLVPESVHLGGRLVGALAFGGVSPAIPLITLIVILLLIGLTGQGVSPTPSQDGAAGSLAFGARAGYPGSYPYPYPHPTDTAPVPSKAPVPELPRPPRPRSSYPGPPYPRPYPPYPRPPERPPISQPRVLFRILPRKLCAGACAQLSWEVDNVDRVDLDGREVGHRGIVTVCPRQSASYNLSWTALDGRRDRRSVGVVVGACPGPEPKADPYPPIVDPTPTRTPTPGPVGTTVTPTPVTPTPSPIAYPPPAATPTPFACPGLDAPEAVVREALAHPEQVLDWMVLCNPDAPFHPLNNTHRTALNKLNPNTPYHPQFNRLVYKCGCR